MMRSFLKRLFLSGGGSIRFGWRLAGGAAAYLLGRSRRAAFICGVMGVLLADIAVGIGNWARGVDQTLVLGGADYLMESRAKAAAELYHAGRCELFIPTGGVLRDSIYGRLTEAQILKNHMMDFGVPADKIITENQATTTRENFQFCGRILADLRPGIRLVTVTSLGHAVRSLALAKAYLPAYQHAAYAAHVSTDCKERFGSSQEMRHRALKECLSLRAYVEWGLIPDFPLS